MRSALLPPPGHFVFLLRQVQRAELFAGILLFLLSACSIAAPAPALPTSASSVTAYGSITSMPTAVPTQTPASLTTTAIALPAMPLRATGISFVDPLHGWVFGNRGQAPSYTVALASTTDGGKSWQPLPLPSSNFDTAYSYDIASQIQGGIFFINAKDGWLFYGGLYSTHDGGLTWTNEPTDGMITRMDRAPDGTVWALEKNDDEWIVKKVVVAPYQQWRQLISNFRLPVDKFSIALADAKHTWISHSEAFELLYTDDGGSTWQNLGKPCKLGGGGWVIAVSAHTLWYACGYGGAGPWGNKLVVSSSDGGQTCRKGQGIHDARP